MDLASMEFYVYACLYYVVVEDSIWHRLFYLGIWFFDFHIVSLTFFICLAILDVSVLRMFDVQSKIYTSYMTNILNIFFKISVIKFRRFHRLSLLMCRLKS